MKLTLKFTHIFTAAAFCLFLFAASSFISSAASSGLYEISSATSEAYVLDARTCTVLGSNEQTLQLYDRLDVNQQKFYLEEMPGSSWRLSVLSSGMAVTVTEQEDGSKNISLTELRKDAALGTRTVQSFFLTDAGSGFVYIQTQDGFFLTLADSFAHRGTGVVLKEFTGRDNQKWKLTAAWPSATANADTDLFNPYTDGGMYENLVISIKTDEMLDTLTASDFAAWVSISEEEHALVYDTDAITAYVQSLADQYNTVGTEREFVTSFGNTITISSGSYGWSMNVAETVSRLIETSRQNGSVTMEAVWDSRGNILTKGKNDLTDSYVEVDLTDQLVWLYKNGEVLLSSECVSGTYQNEERRTPGGIYSIYYKQSPAVLKGEDYSSPVTYWMPFNGGIGLHDASWRYEFGGNIYQYSGSHGCINLPYWAAEILYENTYVGYIVICYY